MSLPQQQDHRTMGHLHYNKGKFQEAVQAYNKALEQSPHDANILGYRSAAYYKLQDYHNALKDADAALQHDASNEKAIYRTAMALIGLRRYQDALDFLTLHISDNYFTMQDVQKNNLINIKLQLTDQLKGEYDMKHFIKPGGRITTTRKTFRACAEYMGPIKLVEIPLKGRGYVAETTIKAGQLIMVSKALAIIEEKKELSLPGLSLSLLILRNLKLNPDLKADVYNLYAGPKAPCTEVENINPQRCSEVKLMDKICQYNGFNIYTLCDGSSAKGLWLNPSYFNHSCVGINTWTLTHKDFMFIRATKDIQPKEEIVINYISPFMPYEKRLQIFTALDFICDCQLCQLEKNESESMQKSRDEILKKLQKYPKGAIYSNEHLKNLKRLVVGLKMLRPVPELNFPLILAQEKLITHYVMTKNFVVASVMLKRHYNLTRGVFNDASLQALVKLVSALSDGKMTSQLQKMDSVIRKEMKIYFGNEEIDIKSLGFFLN